MHITGIIIMISMLLLNIIESKVIKETIHRGISLDNEWYSDANGYIYTDISTKSIGLKTTPTYLVSVISSSPSLSSIGGGGISSSIDLDGILSKIDPFANITGIHTPRNVSPNGFRVRLSYIDGDSRNLTVDTAKFGKWRVRWVAITNEHPKLKDLTGGNIASQISALELLVNEDPEVVKGILSTDYQINVQEHKRIEKERELARIKKENDKKKKEEEEKKKKEEKLKKKKEKEEEDKEKKDKSTDNGDDKDKKNDDKKAESS